MLTRGIAVVLGIVGLYLNRWHGQGIAGGGNILPFAHSLVGLGTNHSIHSVVGLVLLGAAIWIWFRARATVMASQT